MNVPFFLLIGAVMGDWSLRPKAFRKWHFMFSDDVFFPVNHSLKQNSGQTVDYFGYLFHPLENETFPDSWDPSFKMCVCAGTISSYQSQRCNNSQQSKASSLFESLNSEKSFSSNESKKGPVTIRRCWAGWGWHWAGSFISRFLVSECDTQL